MRIEDVVSQDYKLRGSGRYLKGVEHDSLVVDLEKQIFFWNSKEIAGDIYAWLTKIKFYTPESAREYIRENFPAFKVSYKPRMKGDEVVVNPNLVDAFFNLGKRHREYWYSRGYSDATIDMFRLGYSGDWYVIPIFIGGKFRNFQCRTPDKKMKHWYSGIGPLPFNLDYVKNKPWFVLTEGPVDAIMCMQNGIPAMSTNTGAGYFEPQWVGELPLLERMYVAYDNNEAGRKGAKGIGKLIGNCVKIYTFDGYDDGYDVSDYFNNGGDAAELMRRLEEGRYWFQL